MAIAKLSLINIVGEMSKLDDVISRCLDRGDFHPEKTMDYSGGIRGMEAINEENPYTGLLQRFTDLGAQAGMNPQFSHKKAVKSVFGSDIQQELKQYQEFYDAFQGELRELQDEKNYLAGEVEQDETALTHLSHVNAMDVDFDSLFSCQYLKLRIGRLPLDSAEKLDFYPDKLFLFVSLGTEKNYNWGVYFAPNDYATEIDELFSSLYFERIRVPDFVHGTPEAAFQKIKEDLEENRRKLLETQEKLKTLIENRRVPYFDIYDRLCFLSESFEIRRYVATLKRNFVDVFYITGFIQKEDAKSFQEDICRIDGVTVEILPSDSDKRIKEPTKLKNGWFAKPFEMFVEMYGLPSYNDVDPTLFVAFTYCLLFGIMFGDLGQGLVLCLLGALLWKFKRMNIGRVMNRIGISSCIFGVVFGSVFGNEELLTPFYVNVLGLKGKPIEVMAPENTNFILIAAIALGVALICFSIGIDIFLSLRKRDFERAIFSSNGLAGLIFYGALIFAAVMMFLGGVNLFKPGYVLPLLVLPLCVILFKEPLGKLTKGLTPREAKPDGMGEYLMEGAFELFDVLLSFFSNTMSFLRVGGFVLSHAGMMAVVFTLSDMVGNVGSPFVLVIGNLFVMCMEGLIVGIQVLRLEFYEMFSRYFDGDGKPFVAISAAMTE